MKVSAIVSNFNGARFLPRLLDDLAGQRGVEVEIVVVDRNSRDGSAELLVARPGVIVVQEPPETGLVSGYTAGVARATGELLFFCNEDMGFDPDCLRLLAERIDLGRRIGAADPWQFDYGGKAWVHGGVRFRRALWDINSPHPRWAFDFVVPLAAGARIPLPCAGAFLIHRDVFRQLGGWDTRFFLNDEDTDLFLRAWQQDWTCVTVPGARVYHAVGASNTQPLGTATVGRRRYISTFASKSILGLKYFSLSALAIPVAVWAARVLNNLVKLRGRTLLWEMGVLGEILERLPAALAFRRRNERWLHLKPGQGFFSDPDFSSRGLR